MIDRPSRKQVEELILRLLQGGLTNYQLEDLWPRKSNDALIVELPSLLWSFYSDSPETILDPRQFTNETGPFLERLLLFVRSDLEYEWPPTPRTSLPDLFWNFLTGRSPAFDERVTAFATAGDPAIWPFLNGADYENYKTHSDAQNCLKEA